jgi:hypothetical protein
VMYEVLDHDPTHDDIEACLGRLKTALDERELTLQGTGLSIQGHLVFGHGVAQQVYNAL